MFRQCSWVSALVLILGGLLPARADEATALRLVPFPKEVGLQAGSFDLGGRLTLVTAQNTRPLYTELIAEELKRAGLAAPQVSRPTSAKSESPRPIFRLGRTKSMPDGRKLSVEDGHWLSLLAGSKEQAFKIEDLACTASVLDIKQCYSLEIRPEAIVCLAKDEQGLLYGIHTLRQLIRANRRDNRLPCLSIRDWPSLRWRCFQDDVTRGPSPKMGVLKFQADMGSYLKMNLFTYYMEHQFAFKKHPVIGPPDGSLTPEDLKALVDYGRPLHVDILGNQQSFGHFGHILKHPEFAALRETPGILSPVNEASYRLLDDMYSEVCPLLPLEFFNVCCDETEGLGVGPSKELAERIGVGGVYVQHLRRIHDLLKDKYHKRMMMWGDIILQHPKHLDQIPKDTIMLTWAYDPRANFESQIIPFAKSGYEFFVCPGVSNWSRILPDFACATTNIRNFVRDGAKHGAMGMLNTDWEDDSESLNAPTWHGDAWGAECSWNASTTTPEDFNRRIGGVLFGEKGNHFGQAIELLAKTHSLPGMRGMNNSRFWDNDFVPQRSVPMVRPAAERLLAVVRPAIEHLEACQRDATVNADLLDSFLLGARRMELIGQRMLDGLEAVQAYHRACELAPKEAATLLAQIEPLVRKNRDAHEALGRQFAALWQTEAKPYALDRTMGRYAAVMKYYDDLAARLAAARKKAELGQTLPIAEEVGLGMPESFARRAWPHQMVASPLASQDAWAEPSATHRLGLIVRAGAVERFQLPVEIDVALPAIVKSRPVRALCRIGDGPSQEILAQLDPSDKAGKTRLTLLIPGPIAKQGQAAVTVYLGLSKTPQPLPQAVTVQDGPYGRKIIENDKVRLLLGPEGAHVYRWEVKSLGNRDLTMPGESGWAGFADLGGEHRSAKNALVCVACGPALVRFRATEPGGLIKHVGLFGGASWMEVVLSEGASYYWDFDNPQNFAADGPTPGKYLFSNGSTGAVGRQSQGVAAQVGAYGAFWGIKFNEQKLALGLLTPEIGVRFRLAPGAGAGGVGVESSTEASHYVTFAGLLETDPAQTMTRLRNTLNFKTQPVVILHAVQARP